MIKPDDYRRVAEEKVSASNKAAEALGLTGVLDIDPGARVEPANGGAWVTVLLWISDETAARAAQEASHG